jgi:hypothetical protein
MVDVENRPRRFRFRLVGTAIVDSFGLDITGQYLEEVSFSDRAPSVQAHYGAAATTGEPSCHQVHFTRGSGRFLAYYATVVMTREPSCHAVQFTRGSGRHLSYERVILPLSSDGMTVDMLLGGICFDEAYETDFSAPRRANV